MDNQLQFCTVEEAVEEIRQGRMIIVTDDPGRENEADLIIAAEFATPEAINFMVTHARGLVCAPLSPERADALQLPLMTSVNRENMSTAFTVSVDAAHDITTGISAAERSSPFARWQTPKPPSTTLFSRVIHSLSAPFPAECCAAPAIRKPPLTSCAWQAFSPPAFAVKS